KGRWLEDGRRSRGSFNEQTQRYVSGDVRLKLYKGHCHVTGRRSPHALYDSRLASQSDLEWFDSQWAQGFTSLWTLPTRLAAQRQPGAEPRATAGGGQPS